MSKKNLKNQSKPETKHFQTQKFILPGLAVSCLFLVVSCGLITSRLSGGGTSNFNTTTDTTGNSNSNVTNNLSEDKFKVLLEKGREIEKMTFPVKIDPNAIIKGKVFLVKNVEAGSSDYSKNFAFDRQAHSLEELGTVIRIHCGKGKFLGNYKDPSQYGSQEMVKAYGIKCQVSLIDFPGKVVTNQKEFSNNEVNEFISSKKTSLGEFINDPPEGEMTEYINSFLVEKVLPGATRLDEKELIRLPVTLALKPEAELKGKIFIAQKYKKGNAKYNLVSDIDSFDKYNLPFEKFASQPDTLETLVRIVCTPGSLISKVGKTSEFSNKCEVSLIDYPTLTVIAQKIIENRTLDESPAATESERWVVGLPKQEIENYLKSFPGSN